MSTSSPEEIKAEYASSLADLKFNSKPLINVLTMLAEENSPNAEVIVEAIETHLGKVSTEVKLPILYLIDCIVKNVGGAYTALFSQNIVSTFCGVFKAVDEKTRAEMFKLRQTWNEVFPQMKLYAIDVQINLLDPAWPVTAKPPPNSSIHFNPKFLKNTSSSNVNTKVEAAQGAVMPGATNIDKETLLMQEQLIQKQKELLELQQKKLELEVLQTKVKLQEQMKNTIPGRPQNILLKPEVAKQLVPNLKHKPAGLAAAAALHQRNLNTTNGSRVPVSSAPTTASSKPIRDPRLLRQQQQNQTDSNSNVQLGQKTANLDNKNVTSKTGVRKFRNDPRLVVNKDIPPSKNDTPKPNLSSKSQNSVTTFNKSQKIPRASPKNNSDSSSTKSSSNSSLDSPSKAKSEIKHTIRLKRREKVSDDSIKKISPKEKRDRSEKSDSNSSNSTFKDVKMSSKNRNYVRRNLPRVSPEPAQDEDLRSFGPPEKQPRLQNEPTEQSKSVVAGSSPRIPVSVSTSSPALVIPTSTPIVSTPPPVAPLIAVAKDMDVDLRQLPDQIASKKRLSVDSPENNPKKSKAEVFDRLFGDEDTDLRQLAINTDRPSPVQQKHSPISQHSPVRPPSTIELSSPEVTVIENDRPPTPPPPIISFNRDSPKRSDSLKKNLDVLRAKLANATNRPKDKIIPRKMKPVVAEDLDLRQPRIAATRPEIPQPILISPEDVTSIESGSMTKEREAQLLQKIIVQVEREKLKEAKKKEHEEKLNISLQPISDDEFQEDQEEKSISIPPRDALQHMDNFPLEPDNVNLPFNDKDERLITKHLHPKGEYVPPMGPFSSRPRYPGGAPNWRMGRGSRRQWENNHPRGSFRPWRGNWRNSGPNFGREFGPAPFPPEGGPFADEVPAPFNPEIPEQLTNGAVNLDEVKSITIDGTPKDIRFYDETGVVFINWDDPREISFMDDRRTRRITFNDKDSYALGLNEPYREVLIEGVAHKVKLGVPSREIYIDSVPYECFFGNAGIWIELDGTKVLVKLEGPPPQAKIGDVKRTDLVAGKINLFINATIIVPVYLDGKLQKFILDGETNTLKFVNALQTVLINDVPFDIEYGGLPKPIFINGKKHFIRFSVLPKGVRPGRVRIKDMEGTQPMSPYNVDENSQDSTVNDQTEPFNPALDRMRKIGGDSPDRNSNSPNIFQKILEQQNLSNLDVLTNAITPNKVPSAAITDGYKVENQNVTKTEANTAPQIAPPVLNINDLFQKLVASGFVTSVTQPQPAAVVKENKEEDEKPSIQPQPAKARRNVTDYLKPISFSEPESLKDRQKGLYRALYSGMQCSSCGMRFSPEASMQYSQHLDWHFRQNRKGKRNIRVATSRRWYYSLSDWKNYEELEDLEEREKNYFDQQQQAEGAADDAEEEIEIPSVPADPETTNESCEVCRDKFDQFFNEEREEWHLKNAIRVDEKTYHPVCYDDYLESLKEKPEESILEQSVVEEVKPEEPVIPGLEIIIDDDDDEEQPSPTPSDAPEIVSLESEESKVVTEEPEPEPSENKPQPEEEDDDDDDVILNEVAPIKIVVDDDDEEYNPEEPIENLVTIKKEKVEKDDGFVEVSGLVSLQNGGQIKIKAEPVDPDEVALNTSGTSEEDVQEVSVEEEEEDNSVVEVVSVNSELVPSIDGNIELVSSVPSSVTTSGISGNKIKINISKPLPVITKDRENQSDAPFPSETYVDPSEPFPPGEEPEPVSLKPTLRGVKLSKLPAIKKGSELTGLCSIM